MPLPAVVLQRRDVNRPPKVAAWRQPVRVRCRTDCPFPRNSDSKDDLGSAAAGFSVRALGHRDLKPHNVFLIALLRQVPISHCNRRATATLCLTLPSCRKSAPPEAEPSRVLDVRGRPRPSTHRPIVPWLRRRADQVPDQTPLVRATHRDRPRCRGQRLLIAGKLRPKRRAAGDCAAQHFADLPEVVLHTQGSAGAVTVTGARPRAVAGGEGRVAQAHLIAVAVAGARAPHGATGWARGVAATGSRQDKAK